MSTPAGDVADRLERLATHAPSLAVDPDQVWSRGRRRQRRRWAAAVALTVVVAGLGAAAAAPLSRLVDPPVAENSGEWVLPDVVRQPDGWEPAFGRAPGRLSAIGPGSRSSWTGPHPAYWGVSAVTGESRWLDLPATTSGGLPVLSSDGTALAYWASVGDTGTRAGDKFPAPTELRLLDLTTGDEQRWAPKTRHGLVSYGMAWAGDTLWFNAGAYRDAGQNSAQTALHTWRRGSTARDVSDLYAAEVNLTTATTDAQGFLAGTGTASRTTWRATASGDLSRLVLDTNGTVSTPAMSPDGRLVAGVQQGRTEQTYGVARQLLVGDVVDGRARMRPAVPVRTAFVLGWRSPSEVVVMHPSTGGDTNGDGVREYRELWIADLRDPERIGFAPWIAVSATTQPTFAADALTAEVVPAPDAPNAPDPRLFSGGAVILALLLVSAWRVLRRRRGHP